ncbi:hypothetical protein AKJ09_06872 [Labilithrix luteola]|uniref:Uncharacterized protein n=1 Tax=Labilithrix luteola TaxID=1391654 RepID=A0A0K1Q375_9BACT|nr:hypothetical protein AKJ09_06872 [Labilithrix luteola]
MREGPARDEEAHAAALSSARRGRRARLRRPSHRDAAVSAVRARSAGGVAVPVRGTDVPFATVNTCHARAEDEHQADRSLPQDSTLAHHSLHFVHETDLQSYSRPIVSRQGTTRSARVVRRPLRSQDRDDGCVKHESHSSAPCEDVLLATRSIATGARSRRRNHYLTRVECIHRIGKRWCWSA